VLQPGTQVLVAQEIQLMLPATQVQMVQAVQALVPQEIQLKK
jgi:hypothetical protein